jgi:hypothetical protein
MEVERPIFHEANLEYDRLADIQSEIEEARQSVDAEQRNLVVAGYLSIGGIALSVLGFVLSMVLLFNLPNGQFIASTVGMLFSSMVLVYIMFWSRRTSNSIRQSREPNTRQATLVFLVSLYLALYHLLQMTWLIINKSNIYDYLLSLREDDFAWSAKYGAVSFESFWTQQKVMIAFLIVISPLLTFILGFIAFAARSLHSQKYYLSRLALYSSLFALSVCSWFVIYWAQLSFLYEADLPSSPFTYQPTGLKYLAILLVILAIVNSIVNLMRKKSGYLGLGVAYMVICLVLVYLNSSLLKEARKMALVDTSSNSDCKSTMVSIHEQSLASVCPVGGKYLKPGEGCKRSGLTYRWEGINPNELRYLNPACCEVAKLYYQKPFIHLGFWGLATFFTLVLVSFLNFVMADLNNTRIWAGRVTKLLDIVWMVLIGGLFLAFALYFLFRPRVTIEHGLNPQALSFINPDANPIAGLDLVPQSIKTAHQEKAGFRCYGWHQIAFPNITADASSACTDDCIHRVAVLIDEGKVSYGYFEGASVGTQAAKKIFYPGCAGQNQQFVLFYGDLDPVSKLLKTSTICSSETKGPRISIRHTVLKKTSMGEGGLTQAENIQAASNTATNDACLAGYTESMKCNGECSVYFWPSNAQILEKVKGKFFYLIGPDKMEGTSIPASISVEAYRGETKIDSKFNLLSGGIWTLENIPRIYNFSYVLTIKITDSSGKFLPKEVDILISPKDSDLTELSAGRIQLLTPNGKICGEKNQEPCPSSMESVPRLKGTISFMFVTELSTNNAFNELSEIRSYVTILSGHRLKGDPVAKVTSLSLSGKGFVNDLAYGSYTLLVRKPGYNQAVAFVDLQEESNQLPTIVLLPKLGENDLSVTVYTDEEVDFDLFLEVRSDTNFACIVSPYNKYCGYAMKENDVGLRVGKEIITIKSLAAANYMAYLAPSPPYSASCQTGLELDKSNHHFQGLNWNWTEFKKQKPLSSITITGEVNYRGDDEKMDADGVSVSGLIANKPIESENLTSDSKFRIGKIDLTSEITDTELVETSSTAGQLQNTETSKSTTDQAVIIETTQGTKEDTVTEVSPVSEVEASSERSAYSLTETKDAEVTQTSGSGTLTTVATAAQSEATDSDSSFIIEEIWNS